MGNLHIQRGRLHPNGNIQKTSQGNPQFSDLEVNILGYPLSDYDGDVEYVGEDTAKGYKLKPEFLEYTAIEAAGDPIVTAGNVSTYFNLVRGGGGTGGGTGLTPAQELLLLTIPDKMNKTTGTATGDKVLVSSGTTGLENVETTVTTTLLEGFDARITNEANINIAQNLLIAQKSKNANIVRTTTAPNTAPTATEFPTPNDGDTATVVLSNGVQELWNYTGGTWVFATTITPVTLDGNTSIVVRTDNTAGVVPTATEVPTPVNGDTADVYLLDGTREVYAFNGTAWALIKTILPTVDLTTADNGLTKTGSNIQLGGALITPTKVITDATNTFAITGLQAGVPTDNLVTIDPVTGILTITPATTPIVNVANLAALPAVGDPLKLYYTEDTDKAYKWDPASSTYKLIGAEPILTATTTNTGTLTPAQETALPLGISKNATTGEVWIKTADGLVTKIEDVKSVCVLSTAQNIVANGSYTFNHNLNDLNPIIQGYDGAGVVLVNQPNIAFTVVDANNVKVEIGSVPVTGLKIKVCGGAMVTYTPSTVATETDPVFLAQKGQVNGVATLDATGKVPASQLPTITSSPTNLALGTPTPTGTPVTNSNGTGFTIPNTVQNYTNLAGLPTTGQLGVIYITNDTDLSYVWDTVTSTYKPLSAGSTATADGKNKNIKRTNATTNVAPTAVEKPSPINGDTAIISLTDGTVEYWSYNGTAWVKDFANKIVPEKFFDTFGYFDDTPAPTTTPVVGTAVDILVIGAPYTITNPSPVYTYKIILYPQGFVSGKQYSGNNVTFQLEMTTNGGASWTVQATNALNQVGDVTRAFTFGDHLPVVLAPSGTTTFQFRLTAQGSAAASMDIYYAATTLDGWAGSF